MSRRRRLQMVAVAVGLVLTACGGEDTTGVAETMATAPSTTASTSGEPETSAPGPETSAPQSETTFPNGGGVETTGAPATPEPADPVEQGEPLFAGLDGQLDLVTPTSGGGIRPELEWEPFPGADHYSLYLYAPDGSVYWVWSGMGTSVHVGGEPQLRDGAPGPSVIGGMSWAVMAHDANQIAIAVSARRSISP